ncbi:hypothetical protein JB92DRAFT_2844176 [Gautieria morchelliformis]|nr:hypothetical protein JB92DRAFT_2844176 [Gautieria morchelliformis]
MNILEHPSSPLDHMCHRTPASKTDGVEGFSMTAPAARPTVPLDDIKSCLKPVLSARRNSGNRHHVRFASISESDNGHLEDDGNPSRASLCSSSSHLTDILEYFPPIPTTAALALTSRPSSALDTSDLMRSCTQSFEQVKPQVAEPNSRFSVPNAPREANKPLAQHSTNLPKSWATDKKKKKKKKKKRDDTGKNTTASSHWAYNPNVPELSCPDRSRTTPGSISLKSLPTSIKPEMHASSAVSPRAHRASPKAADVPNRSSWLHECADYTYYLLEDDEGQISGHLRMRTKRREVRPI